MGDAGDTEAEAIATLEEEVRWILLDQYKVSRSTADLFATKGFGSLDMVRHMGDATPLRYNWRGGRGEAAPCW